METPRINGFAGSEQFTFSDSRTELPFKAAKSGPSIWAVIKKVATSDMQRVSLPVGLNEPVTILQKCCEILGNYDLIEGAASNNLKAKEAKAAEAEEKKDEEGEEVKENELNEGKDKAKEETLVEEGTEQGPPDTTRADADTPEDSCKRLV